MDILVWLFKPIQPFVMHPERIAAVAGILFIGFFVLLSTRRFRSWPILVPAFVWSLFVPWEAYCNAQKYNIRADLVLLYPVLVVVTVWGVAAAFRRRKEERTMAAANMKNKGLLLQLQDLSSC